MRSLLLNFIFFSSSLFLCFSKGSAILQSVVVVPKPSNSKSGIREKIKPVKSINNNKDKTRVKNHTIRNKEVVKPREIEIIGKKNEKFMPKDQLTVFVENDIAGSNNNDSFKARNYRDHRAYNDLRSYIDSRTNDNKQTINKLTDALVKIASRPIIVNINQDKKQNRRSKRNSRKRPNKNLRGLLREQQKLIKENPLKTN